MQPLLEILHSPEARGKALARRPVKYIAHREPAPVFPPPYTNCILASIPATAYQRLQADLEHVELSPGEVLYEAGSKPRYVYFPTTAIVSLLCETSSGASAEICVVGSDGFLGFALFTGDERTHDRAVVSSPGQGFRLESRLLKREACQSSPFLEVLLRHSQALVTQTAQTAVCNRHHSLEQQLCRRLLLMLDRSSRNELSMTHDRIANMLGVRRESITAAAGKLQAAGLIRYFRGRIEILDRYGMEAKSCECYRVAKQETDRFMASGRNYITRAA